MPNKPPRPCSMPGCPELTNDRSGYCPAHLKHTRKINDTARGNSTARGYNYKWQKRSKRFLRENPLCVECLKQGRTVAATEVDHIEPHRGDMVLFWDETNWQPLCGYHHKAKTAKERG